MIKPDHRIISIFRSLVLLFNGCEEFITSDKYQVY